MPQNRRERVICCLPSSFPISPYLGLRKQGVPPFQFIQQETNFLFGRTIHGRGVNKRTTMLKKRIQHRAEESEIQYRLVL